MLRIQKKLNKFKLSIIEEIIRKRVIVSDIKNRDIQMCCIKMDYICDGSFRKVNFLYLKWSDSVVVLVYFMMLVQLRNRLIVFIRKNL